MRIRDMSAACRNNGRGDDSSQGKSMAKSKVSQSQLYEWLTGDEDSRMCRDISDTPCHEQPRNFFLHLFAALGNKLADELSSARLVLRSEEHTSELQSRG